MKRRDSKLVMNSPRFSTRSFSDGSGGYITIRILAQRVTLRGLAGEYLHPGPDRTQSGSSRARMEWTRCAAQPHNRPRINIGANAGGTEAKQEGGVAGSRGGRNTYICVANCTRVRHFGAEWTLPACSGHRGVRVGATRHTRRIGICTNQRAFRHHVGVATTWRDQAGHVGHVGHVGGFRRWPSTHT